jgi:hypothetical protein
VFSLPAALDKEPYRLDVAIPETPITQVDLWLGAPNLDARVSGASGVETLPSEGGTRVRASLPQTTRLSIAWNAVEPEQAKGPAKVYAAPHTVLSVQDDAVRSTARIDLDVLQNSINNVALQLPEGYTLLDVTGDAVGEWKLRGADNRTLFIPFEYARKGKFSVTVRVERAFKDKGGVVPFDGFQVLGAVREGGDLLIEKTTNGEVKIVDTAGLVRLDPREVPGPLSALAQNTFLDAFKYVRPPFRLGLDIQRHEEIAVVSSVIDTANAVTLLLKDGKCVTHLTFSVKNTAKQFLEVRLPAGAEVWSAFVEGRPAKPSKAATGATLIPLNRSRIEGQNLAAFDVEVMYFRNAGAGGPGGRQALTLPNVDLKISQLVWSVYLPTERDYVYFGGTVDKEVQAGGFKPLGQVLKGNRRVLRGLTDSAASFQSLGKVSRSSSDYASRKEMARQSKVYQFRSEFDESQNISEDLYAQQVERELNFFSDVNRQQVAGVVGAGGGNPADPPQGAQRRSNFPLFETARAGKRAGDVERVELAPGGGGPVEAGRCSAPPGRPLPPGADGPAPPRRHRQSRGDLERLGGPPSRRPGLDADGFRAGGPPVHRRRGSCGDGKRALPGPPALFRRDRRAGRGGPGVPGPGESGEIPMTSPAERAVRKPSRGMGLAGALGRAGRRAVDRVFIGGAVVRGGLGGARASPPPVLPAAPLGGVYGRRDAGGGGVETPALFKSTCRWAHAQVNSAPNRKIWLVK